MSTAALQTLAQELAAIVGREHMIDWSADEIVNAAMDRVAQPTRLCVRDIDGVRPQAVVAPAGAEEIAAILRLANERDLVVVPAGSYSAQSIGRAPERVDIVLEMRRLQGIEHYDPGDLTIGVGAGCTAAEVSAIVNAHGQYLPLDAGDTRTIGAILATAAHGPLKHAYGGPRDFCLGVRFVTGDGKLAKAGGRVVKNVAGYDLMKLLIGSHGTLGVIVAASFKLFPAPRQTRTFVCDFPSLDEAAAFRDMVQMSPLTPLALEIMSPLASHYVMSGNSGAPLKPGFGLSGKSDFVWQIALRAAGSDAVLARYRHDLGSAVAREIVGEDELAFWRGVAEFERRIAAEHANAMVIAISVPIASVAKALAAAEKLAPEHNFIFSAVGRAGVGSLLLAFAPLPIQPPVASQYAEAAAALRAALPRDASAAVLRCPREAKPYFDVWGATPTDLDAMRAVRTALDPRQILNRGRFLV